MESGSKSEHQLDIHELFCHYNSLYFDDALGACIVYWSDSRTARSAGMCCCPEGGGCEISLCKHLLKSRSPADVKNTLLHEMIHAFLFITEKKKDHGNHGHSFAAKAKAINSSSKTDPQKPSGGYKITLSHEFVNEDDSYGEPPANDCTENMTNDNSSGSSSCHWHRNKKQCSGRCAKTADKSHYNDKTKVLKVAHETEGDQSKASSSTTGRSKQRSENVEQTKDSSNLKTSERVHDRKLKAITSWTTKIHKRPRTPGLKVDRELSCGDMGNLRKCKKKITGADQWFALYGDEESDEEIEPLVNSRTERRREEKLLRLKDRFPEAEAIGVGCFSQCGENIASIKQSHDAPPHKDNIVYVIDD